jgi:hypothetical protein
MWVPPTEAALSILPSALLAGMSRADSARIRIHVSAGAEIVTRSGVRIGLLVRRDVSTGVRYVTLHWVTVRV